MRKSVITKPVSAPLTPRQLKAAVRELTSRDPALASVIGDYGIPPLWARPTGFPTLVHIILEQQVSLSSARAAFNRLVAATNPLTPARLLLLSDDELKTIGFSRQKAQYARLLAEAVIQGELSLEQLDLLDDASCRLELMKLKGIGRWTADIYLLMALGRPNVWPAGDLALAIAAQHLLGLTTRPTPEELEELGHRWHPWRAVAARILWHYYLSRPRR